MNKPKIYLYCLPSAFLPDDVVGYAMSENGECLACHISSNANWSQKDMGYVQGGHCEHQRAKYAERYPDGYEMVWLDEIELDTHEGFQAAWKLNQERQVEAE